MVLANPTYETIIVLTTQRASTYLCANFTVLSVELKKHRNLKS